MSQAATDEPARITSHHFANAACVQHAATLRHRGYPERCEFGTVAPGEPGEDHAGGSGNWLGSVLMNIMGCMPLRRIWRACRRIRR